MKALGIITLILSCLAIVAGTTFKIQHWPGYPILLGGGMVGVILSGFLLKRH